MLKHDAIRHFGSASQLARALDIAPASVSEWGELVPLGRAYQLQVITGGALQVNQSAYTKNGIQETPDTAS
jgi:hypothetical protein